MVKSNIKIIIPQKFIHFQNIIIKKKNNNKYREAIEQKCKNKLSLELPRQLKSLRLGQPTIYQNTKQRNDIIQIVFSIVESH